MEINIYDLANMRQRLMEKYWKGMITSEEMRILNILEQEVDAINQQRKSHRQSKHLIGGQYENF